MFSWIPLIGPIIQGFTSIFSGYFSEKTAVIQAEVQTEKTAAQIIKDTNDDIALRIMRDMAVLPVVVWSMVIGWDTIIAYHYPDWMWKIPAYPQSVGYLPYIVLVFLFGNIGLNIWRNKI